MGQVLVGRQPDLGAEGPHQVELVEPGVLGERVEGDLVGQGVVEEGASPAHRPWRLRPLPHGGLVQRSSLSVSATSVARSISGRRADQRGVHGEREPGGALPGPKPDALKCNGAAQAHGVGRGGDKLGREPGALERERRVDAQVAVDLAGLLELERARDMGAHPAAVPAVEGALVHHHDREVLGVGDLRAILVLHPEHARHRGGVGPPEPDPPAIVGGQHEPSLGQPRGLAWAIWRYGLLDCS